MNTHTANPNGSESKLVFIATQGSIEPVLNEFFARLGGAGLEYAAWHSDTERAAGLYRRAVEQAVGDILPHVRTLVAGKGVPVAELAGAMPNLRLAISTDPEFRDITSVNGGTDFRYVDTQPASLVSYGLVAQEMLDYLTNGSSASASPVPEH